MQTMNFLSLLLALCLIFATSIDAIDSTVPGGDTGVAQRDCEAPLVGSLWTTLCSNATTNTECTGRCLEKTDRLEQNLYLTFTMECIDSVWQGQLKENGVWGEVALSVDTVDRFCPHVTPLDNAQGVTAAPNAVVLEFSLSMELDLVRETELRLNILQVLADQINGNTDTTNNIIGLELFLDVELSAVTAADMAKICLIEIDGVDVTITMIPVDLTLPEYAGFTTAGGVAISPIVAFDAFTDEWEDPASPFRATHADIIDVQQSIVVSSVAACPDGSYQDVCPIIASSSDDDSTLVIIIVILLLAIAAGSGFYYYKTHDKDSKFDDLQVSTEMTGVSNKPLPVPQFEEGGFEAHTNDDKGEDDLLHVTIG